MNVRTHAVDRGDVRHVVIAMGSDSGSGKCVGL
jgi:predicted RNA-binding protein with TRAM domain